MSQGLSIKGDFNNRDAITLKLMEGTPVTYRREDIDSIIGAPNEGSTLIMATPAPDTGQKIFVKVKEASSIIANFLNNCPTDRYIEEVILPEVLDRQRERLSGALAQLDNNLVLSEAMTKRQAELQLLNSELRRVSDAISRHEQESARLWGVSVLDAIYARAQKNYTHPAESRAVRIAEKMFGKTFLQEAQDHAANIMRRQDLKDQIESMRKAEERKPLFFEFVTAKDYLEGQKYIRHLLQTNELDQASQDLLTRLKKGHADKNRPPPGQGFTLHKVGHSFGDGEAEKYVYVREGEGHEERKKFAIEYCFPDRIAAPSGQRPPYHGRAYEHPIG